MSTPTAETFKTLYDATVTVLMPMYGSIECILRRWITTSQEGISAPEYEKSGRKSTCIGSQGFAYLLGLSTIATMPELLSSTGGQRSLNG